MSIPGSTNRPPKKRAAPKPFRRLVLLLDYREPGHVLVDLQPVTLQPLAWKLLVCLAEAPGSVVPYDELYKTLWGDTVVEMNQLSYQKNHIMTAITAVSPGRSDLILTFPKIGFMLDLSPREVLIIPNHIIRRPPIPAHELF